MAESTVPDAGLLVTLSADAMANLTTVRFAWSLFPEDRSRMYGGNAVGEFMAPDRMSAHLSSTDGEVAEDLVAVGEKLWVRSAGVQWQLTNPNTFHVAVLPAGVRTPISAWMVPYLLNPTVTDTGAAYTLSSGWDVARAGGPYGTSNYGMIGIVHDLGRFLSGATDELVLVIDKATMLVVSIETKTLVPIPDVTGEPPVLITYRVRIDYWDFNDQSIVVVAPE